MQVFSTNLLYDVIAESNLKKRELNFCLFVAFFGRKQTNEKQKDLFVFPLFHILLNNLKSAIIYLKSI